MWEGRIVSIHIAPEAGAPMQSVAEARAVPGRGLEGDRYFSGRGYYSGKPSVGGRELTLIAVETLEALARGIPDAAGGTIRATLAPADTRRNLATRGVPLEILVGREFMVGGVRLRGTRPCEPCRHLEELTQPGVLRALVGRGGLRAQIVGPGIIRVGDPVRPA
jgi:MOSC domain-containing protein YiiM